ncbi:hypothetical protein ACEWY4_006698 [Coilia grayii]|uniref:Uncharacterized protein n=1 Tax=Coilia grayii TaxID=363190 RepID=A0ABD1KEM3_9TELE
MLCSNVLHEGLTFIFALRMLVKVKCKGEQKYIKISDPTLEVFLNQVFVKFHIGPKDQAGLKVYDESGTEIDDDVFEDVVKDPNCGVLKLKPAEDDGECKMFSQYEQSMAYWAIYGKVFFFTCSLQVIENILQKKPGGDRIIKEYGRTKALTDSSRRQMVNIVVAEMTETHGTTPSRTIREMYAKGIVSLFPNLKDPFSEKGYEHFYDPDSGSGYLAWRIKTIQRKSSEERRSPAHNECNRGPASERDVPEPELSEEQLREAISFMKHASDEEAVRMKMKQTFSSRQKMVHDAQQSPHVLATFPRFADVKGLIEQDFVSLFGEETSAKLLERWPTLFKEKTIRQSKGLSASSIELQELIQAADSPLSGNEDLYGWDSDLSSILLLLHLLPPSAQGRKKPGKMSATQAMGNLVVFRKVRRNSIQGHLDSIVQTRQPYLLAVGTSRRSVHEFFIIVDKMAIPCKATSSLGAFDELFKAHFVFGTEYCESLRNMYTFIQTTIYNIDVGHIRENPRVIELRARFLQ